MVNILFATPTPPSSNTAAAPLASSAITVQVTVTNVPAALENLMRMIQTNALPMGTIEGNNLQLSTAMGSLTVALAQNLAFAEKQTLTQQLINLSQAGRPLTLTLQPGAPPTQGTLTVPTLPTSAQSTIPNAAQTAPLSSTAPQPLNVGNDLSAIVLPSLPKTEAPAAEPVMPKTYGSATAPPPAASLPAQPMQGATPGIENQLAMPQNAAVPLPSAASEAAPAGPPSLLVAGHEVSLHIDAVLPDFPAASTRMPPLAQNQIFATVTGTGTNGQLILKAADATLFVKSPVTAPVGTSMIVSVEAAKGAPLVTIPEADAKFNALPEVMAALSQSHQPVFQQVMAAHIPQPNEALPGALLFFLSAFRQSNVRDWLGNEAVNRLVDMGKGPSLRSLSKELSEAGQAVNDPVVGEWRAYPIPLYAQQNFHTLALYVHSDRDERKETADAPAANKIRFLIDMRLSRLGSMQMDGFVQPKKMDMILRSETPLPEGLHEELRTSYLKALVAVGFAGSLNFQVGRQYWMVMQKTAKTGIVT